MIQMDNDGTAEVRRRLRSAEAQIDRLEGLVMMMALGIAPHEMPERYRELLAGITGMGHTKT